jgi:gliding motility-associated-like protein
MGFAQSNLIPNPGFEEYDACPRTLAEFDGTLKYWKTANTGTPNFFNTCATSPDVGVPRNYFGSRTPYRGSGYIGLLTGAAFREYVSVTLKETLKANTTYIFSFYASSVSSQGCTSNGMDIVFSPTETLPSNSVGNLEHTPSLTLSPNYFQDQWVYTQGCYRAKGGEKTLIIGDFQYPLPHHSCPGNGGVSYYYLDEVWLFEQTTPPPQVIHRRFCDVSFPFEVDARQLTGISTDTATAIWVWDGIDGAQKKRIEKEGFYKLQVILSDCTIKSYEIYIENFGCLEKLFAPNIFTPNGDGQNDEWTFYMEGVEIVRCMIFDRIGQLIWDQPGAEPGWDGNFRQKPAPEGVYVFLIQYQNISTGKSGIRKGSVSLVR